MLNWHIPILQIIIIFLELWNFIIFFLNKIRQELILLLEGSNGITVEVDLVLCVDYLIVDILGFALQILVVLSEFWILARFFYQFCPKLLDVGECSLDLLNGAW